MLLFRGVVAELSELRSTRHNACSPLFRPYDGSGGTGGGGEGKECFYM